MRSVRLNNGLQVWIRPIAAADGWRLQRALQVMSAQTIQRRFLSLRRRFTDAELKHLTEVDGVNHIALVAMDVSSGELAAVARCVRDTQDPTLAEWAIVVGDPYQGYGLGTVLIRELVDAARAQGIERFSAIMDGENRTVMHLLRHIADRFESDHFDHGVREVVVSLAA
jgi:RimJ/RimL family protein N-acetyltransferase